MDLDKVEKDRGDIDASFNLIGVRNNQGIPPMGMPSASTSGKAGAVYVASQSRK